MYDILYIYINYTAKPSKLKATTDGHRIVGGEEAKAHEFPFIADLTRGYHYCGGSIIHPKWIMTAAHCSQAAADDYVIVAGEHDEEEYEGVELRRSVKRIVVHPDYDA